MTDKKTEEFLSKKSAYTNELFHHFVTTFKTIGSIEVSAAKTMIGISNEHKRIAWITQLGRNFIHVIFMFKKPYADNLCFTKISQVPGTSQFNHHFRMIYKNDVNDEVLHFMKLAIMEA